MEIKKSPHANLEGQTGSRVLMGLLTVLAVLFVAFEWTQTTPRTNNDLLAAEDISLEEELIPITMPEKKTTPPPPQAVVTVETIEIVDDKSEVEETTIASMEDQTDVIEIVETEPIVEDEPTDEDEPLPAAQVQPEFPGGAAALKKYLNDNLRYPPIPRNQGIQGRVIVAFVVNKDGSIVDITVMKALDPYLDKEAVRVVSAMPKWKPGTVQGRPVRVRYTIPVQFIISD